MRHAIMIIMALAGLVAAGNNANTWKDTASITPDTLKENTLVYTAALDLSGALDANDGLTVIAMGTDTSEAGFASDSLQFIWGFQPGYRVLNRTGTLDTAWGDRVIVDTFTIAELGKAFDADWVLPATTGLPTAAWDNTTDTTNVSGCITQIRYFKPQWAELIKFWCKGLANGSGDGKVFVKFAIRNRLYQATRGK